MSERADSTEISQTAEGRLERSNLTTAQYLLWVGQSLHPNLPLYNMIHTFELREPVQLASFREAFRLLLRSSDALRTVVSVEGQVPQQRVLEFADYELEFVDLAAEPEPQQSCRRWLERRNARNHDPGRALFDSALLKLGERLYLWYLNIHHLVADGWAFGLAFRRLSEFYETLEHGGQPEPAEWPQFARYQELERKQRQKAGFARAREYWQSKLSGVSSETDFFYPVRVEADPNRTRRETLELGARRSARLRELVDSGPLRWFSEDLSILAVFAGIVAVVACRMSGKDCVLVGSPFHNRSSADARETIGLFMEIGVVSIEVKPDDTFVSLVRRVHGELAEVLRYVRAGISSTQINNAFDLLVNYVRADFARPDDGAAETEWLHSGFGDAQHKLRLQVQDFNRRGTFALHLDLAESVFDERRRVETLAIFDQVLNRFLNEPADLVAGFPLLEYREQQARVVVFNRTDGAMAADSVVGLIEAQTTLTPDAVALVERGRARDSERSLTYRALDRESNRLCNRLRAAGVDEETRVAVFTERSVDTVVAILAILKAGGAFVPLDPAQPERRIRDLLKASEARLVLTQRALAERLGKHVTTLLLDDPSAASEADMLPATLAAPRPSQLAYVLFTSGSTGRPKGVMIEHRSLANYVDWARGHYCGAERLDFALYSSLAFDLTITSLFVPLCCGATLHIYPDSPSAPGLAVLDAVRDDRAQILKLTPAHLALILSTDATPTRLRKLIVGGEDLKRALALRALSRLSPETELYNEYGPTEATVGCMIHRFDPTADPEDSVPIGMPIRNARIYVLDAALHPCPSEVPGELCVGGLGVARGYQSLEDTERPLFVDSPFVAGERLYQTGDRACWDRNGRLRFLGRNDDQVKIRGARIELGEVESHVSAHPAISNVAVTAVDTGLSPSETDETRCTRCGLEAAFPGAYFDADGVCNTCLDFERYRKRVEPYFGDLEGLRAILDRARTSENGAYDCLMLLSGGKDSTYALCRLVELGYRVLALTLDNGFLSEQAMQNIRRVAAHLCVDHVFVSTPHMNRIFADSLKRFSNVCNGCFKTLYTLSINEALSRGLRVIVTGLARGQMFETRLSDMYGARVFDAEEIDRRILAARRAYHRIDDAVSETLDVKRVRDPDTFSRVEIVDFYRYCDVSLEEMLTYLAEKVPWIRPADTGRSTNCRINDVGIYVHKLERGYHNYSLPYSWDVRLGHKTRSEAVTELEDDIDTAMVDAVLEEIGYSAKAETGEESRRRLAAYYVASEPVTGSQLREFLKHRLPDYAVPSYYLQLEELPLTPNGKVNRTALPAPSATDLGRSEEAIAPEGELEALLVEVWKSIFKLDEVGVEDNFFDLGGDSIIGIQLISEAGRRGVELSATQIFDHQTIRALAPQVHFERQPLKDDMPVGGECPLTPAQIAFFERRPEEPNRWVQWVELRLPSAVGRNLLRAAFDAVLERHEILSARFERGNGAWTQTTAGNPGFKLLTAADLVPPEREPRNPQTADLAELLAQSLDIGQGRLLAAALMEADAPDAEQRLLVVCHQLVIDGVSWWTLLQDLDLAVRDLSQGREASLSRAGTTYRHWAERLNQHALRPELEQAAQYWFEMLESPATGLPAELNERFQTRPNGGMTQTEGRDADETLTTMLLGEAHDAYGTHVAEVLFAALATTLSAWSKSEELVIDLEGHGREPILEDLPIARTIGRFTTSTPVRIGLGPDRDPSRVIPAAKECLRAAAERAGEFELLHRSSPNRTLRQRLDTLARAAVSFTYLGELDRLAYRSETLRLHGPLSSIDSPRNPRAHAIEVHAMVLASQLRVSWSFDAELVAKEQIDELAASFLAALHRLLEHCLSAQERRYTPSDFPEASLSQNELDELMAEFGEESQPGNERR